MEQAIKEARKVSSAMRQLSQTISSNTESVQKFRKNLVRMDVKPKVVRHRENPLYTGWVHDEKYGYATFFLNGWPLKFVRVIN
jgi:hypothetical protein